MLAEERPTGAEGGPGRWQERPTCWIRCFAATEFPEFLTLAAYERWMS